MPKHKKNTARAQQRAEAKAYISKQQSASKSSKQITPKKQQQLIPSSQEISPDSSGSPTLDDRLNALPEELSDEIFSWLLVRPVKWCAEHEEDCPLRNPELTSSPFENIRPQMVLSKATCPQAFCNVPASQWRRRTRPIFSDPWRSQWAPAVRNEFLCSTCWDARFRSHRVPRVDSLPCLCARNRRSEGLAALLVCKKWYEQGARVLYTRNTFAFATPGECLEFFTNLNPRWSALVSKVSLLALAPVREDHESSGEELETAALHVKELREAWAMLRKLPALSELELDALFLTSLNCVRVFRGKALTNIRKIQFTQSMPMMFDEAPRDFVWPRRAVREAIEENEFSVDVARGIKGLRHGWIKGHCRGDRKAVHDEQIQYAARFNTSMARDVRDEDSWMGAI